MSQLTDSRGNVITPDAEVSELAASKVKLSPIPGLFSVNAQSAINELNSKIEGGGGSVGGGDGSATAAFTRQMLNIAYSSIDARHVINTKEHFLYAMSLGFNSLKADMRLTSDNKIVLCHDAGFTLGTQADVPSKGEDVVGRILPYDSHNMTLIHDMTCSDVLALEHFNRVAYGYLGYRSNPTTLEEFLKICKLYGLIPYITFRDEYVNATAVELKRCLYKYGLYEQAIINCYHADNAAVEVNSVLPGVQICYTVDRYSKTHRSIQTEIDSAYNLNCKFVCINSADLSLLTDADIQYAQARGIYMLAWGIDTDSLYQDCISAGINGGQITKGVDTQGGVELRTWSNAAITEMLKSLNV